MEDKKKLWDQQRVERERIRKEFKEKTRQLKEELAQKEMRIEVEKQKQIKSEIDLSEIEFFNALTAEINSFEAKERDIENNCRTQEMIEKSKLLDDFKQRIEKFSTNTVTKMKDIEEKNRMNGNRELRAEKEKNVTEFESNIERMNKMIIDLEKTLELKETEVCEQKTTNVLLNVSTPLVQLKTPSDQTNRPIDLSEHKKPKSPVKTPLVTLKTPSEAMDTSIDLTPKPKTEQMKGRTEDKKLKSPQKETKEKNEKTDPKKKMKKEDKKETKKEDKKETKKEDKKETKKEDKKETKKKTNPKDPKKKDGNKPWTDLNKFG